MKGKKASGIIDYSSDLIAFLFLVAMVLWFSHEMVWNKKVPFFRDLGPYFYPMRFNLAMSFQSGELPLWNRHVAMGFPLAANFQSGAFYPPHLLFLLFSFFDAIRFLFLFHYFVAATGSYFLCRQWQYPPYLALIGSILFTFGGMIVSLSNLMDHFQSAVWLPWVLFFWERSVRSRSWRNFLLLIFLLANQFLAGSPEIYGMSLGLLLLDGLRIKAEEKSITYPKLILLFLAANGLVAGLAMVQILPTVELFLRSSRSETIPYAHATHLSLSPLNLVNLFFLDKEVNLEALLGLRLFFSREIPLIVVLYLGAIVLPGISLWLFLSSLKEKTVLLGLVTVSVILAMGGYTPFYAFLFKHLTFLGLIRFPEKFLFISSALILYMALTGLSRFLRSDHSPQIASWVVLASPLVFFFPIYLWLRIHMDTLIQFIARVKQTSPLDVSTLMISSGVLTHLERQMALTLGIFLLLFLWKAGRLRSGLLQILLVGLTFLDLYSAHRPYQFLLDPQLVYQKPRVLDTPDKEPYRLFYNYNLSYLHANYYTFNHRPFAETVYSVFNNLLPNTGVFHAFDYMQELDALGRKPYSLFIDAGQNLAPEKLYRLLGILNVKYLNSLQPLPPGDIKLLHYFPEYPSWLYRVDRVVPRTYIASKVIVEADPSKSLGRLTSVEFDPLKEVILEQPLPIPAKNGFQARARIINYSNSQVTIRASLDGAGILVLADSFYPGWRAYVDGKEREILRANFFFRGVPLLAGEHLVEFRYRPLSFKIGLVVSLITLFGMIIGSIVVYTRNQAGKGAVSGPA